MARISRGKFRYLCSLYFTRRGYFDIRCGKHRNTFAMEIAKRGYYEGCRQLHNDCDLEIMVAPVACGNITILRDKERRDAFATRDITSKYPDKLATIDEANVFSPGKRTHVAVMEEPDGDEVVLAGGVWQRLRAVSNPAIDLPEGGRSERRMGMSSGTEVKHGVDGSYVAPPPTA